MIFFLLFSYCFFLMKLMLGNLSLLLLLPVEFIHHGTISTHIKQVSLLLLPELLRLQRRVSSPSRPRHPSRWSGRDSLVGGRWLAPTPSALGQASREAEQGGGEGVDNRCREEESLNLMY